MIASICSGQWSVASSPVGEGSGPVVSGELRNRVLGKKLGFGGGLCSV